MRVKSVMGALALAALAVGPAAAADYAGRSVYAHKGYARDIALERGYTGALPSCADPAVQGYVASRFASREREYWGSALQLTDFRRTREIGYRSWGLSFIPRRFCTAQAYTTDGRRRTVSYNIAEGLSLGGLSWGVEWCVSGLDRNLAFAPHCKMARP